MSMHDLELVQLEATLRITMIIPVDLEAEIPGKGEPLRFLGSES